MFKHGHDLCLTFTCLELIGILKRSVSTFICWPTSDSRPDISKIDNGQSQKWNVRHLAGNSMLTFDAIWNKIKCIPCQILKL